MVRLLYFSNEGSGFAREFVFGFGSGTGIRTLNMWLTDRWRPFRASYGNLTVTATCLEALLQ